MIIGLTGSLCAGKGTVAEFLKQRGFEYASLSDVLREYLDSNGIERTRANLVSTANRLRESYGSAILAKWALEKIKAGKAIIDGIRNPEEVKELRQRPDFFLVAVDAPEETRFKRMLARPRGEKDPKTMREFRKLDKSDKGVGQKDNAQQVGKCMKMADIVIINDKTLDILHKKCEKMLEDVERRKLKSSRPDWDEYFLKMALLVAERSTCRRHHIGAIIVKNKRVISTGYNGAAAGVKDCLELGCLKDQLKLASGEFQEKCRAIHAEQNAIIQAALHGISTEGTTLYCTHNPCFVCAKSLANAKIKRVVSFSDYADRSFIDLFKELGIEYERKQMPKREISNLP